jgi:hypothetical protein
VRAQAVEQPPQGTPNLDAVRAWRIAQRFGLDSTPADQ